ncbi:hypothetical protein NMK34_23770 [Micromonospora sp. BRA006-A]|uniref:hypothetical protein n=1 Tax=Micromonospora sp. BRA006-A TaxID=2962860 RepID=UPI00296F43A6|nr:hypothetical protein [Micromonospora sp. BRA006-A]MDW3849636.1 hypothetical protein [Micromonospora sp. BRA006-A]MEE3918162.1 hypothetical protein [Micromonospora sp. BRA006-A]
MTDTRNTDPLAVWGERIALGAAVLLTAKGEFDLAVMAHFAPGIAWIFPVMLDVYVITAFHKRRWLDVIISFSLMLFSQAAVHLVPVWIDFDGGEQAPWGLVLAVACIAPIVVVRVKALTGKTAAEREAEARDYQLAADAREARAEAEEATRKAAEERAGREAEERKRKAAEERVEAEEHNRKKAEEQAEEDRKALDLFRSRHAEERAEEDRKNREQVTLLKAQHAEAAARFRQQLDEAQSAGREAREQAAKVSDESSRTAGQLEEARRMAEQAVADKVTAEQHAAAVEQSRQAVVEELARVRAAHDRLLRKAEEADRKSAISSGSGNRKSNRKSAVSSGAEDRKSIAAVPVALPVPAPEDVPALPGVSADLVARVVAALEAEPAATQARLAELAGTSERSVRNVQKALAAVPAADDDRAAV